MLADKIFHYSYSQIDEHKPAEFCSLALKNSLTLDLGLGYFSSASFHVLANGMAQFIVNGGKMNLYINQYMSEEDYRLFKGKYDNYFDKKIATSLLEMQKTFSQRDEHFFQCLAYLIKTKRINVKVIVFVKGGLPHEKYGIFTDENGNKIYFCGSMNMTANALLDNLETIECTCSWKGKDSLDKVKNMEAHFLKVLNGNSENIHVYEAREFCNEIVRSYSGKDPEQLLKREKEFVDAWQKDNYINVTKVPHFPTKYKDGARPYQEEAYQEWIANGKKGIFAMATGTGKTVTSLNCALHEYQVDGYYHLLILVPTLDLVEQWKEELKAFGFRKILGVSSLNASWRKEMLEIVRKIQRGVNVDFCIISTYDSFVNEDFQSMLSKLSETMLLIADEAHNIGSKRVKACFKDLTITKRIGLSATPERIYDEDGTRLIAQFFADKRPYVFSFPMSKAIEEGRLCKYYYFPYIVYLNNDEMALYSILTRKLALLWDSEKCQFKNKMEAEKLLMNRKRIIHKCQDKVRAFREILQDIGDEKLKYTFVYAPQGNYEHSELEEEYECNSFIQRLLDETKEIYPNKRCNTFVGTDSKDKRATLLKAFGQGTIDVLFAMKCLDEGVDVPRAECGIFTSSTGNPREFIQRRGRLLRTHAEKTFSYIYDMVVIPSTVNREECNSSMERNQVKAELKRVAYFASLAVNCYANNGAYEVLSNVAQHFGIVWSELFEDVEQ